MERNKHPDFHRTRMLAGKVPDPNCEHEWLKMTGPGARGESICPYCLGITTEKDNGF